MTGQIADGTLEHPIESLRDWKQILRMLYPVLVLVAGIEVLLWAHWNSLVFTAIGWENPKYSHGYLVPIFAAVLMWIWRDESKEIVKPVATAGGVLLGIGLLLCVLPFVAEDLAMVLGNAVGKSVPEAIGVGCAIAGAFLLIQPRIDFASVPMSDRWIGFGVLMAAEGLRVFSTYKAMITPELFSVIPALAGVFIMAGGLQIMRWAGWALLFLVFMLPLPGALDKHLSGNLKTVATRSSTFLLQTIGIQSHYEGNDIFVGAKEFPLTVEDACSGLRMLTIFGALCFAVALLCDRPLWQRIVVMLSWIPIALVVNIVRITLTGVFYVIFPSSYVELQHFFHNMWGWVMMPMALGLLLVEFKILAHLVVEDDDEIDSPPMPFSPTANNPKSKMSSAASSQPATTKTAAGNGNGASGGVAGGAVAGRSGATGIGASGSSSSSPPNAPPRQRAPN
jgi:exosortase